ncbi:hypothetical protein S245_048354, partial [Arachis hypogaea]
VSLAQESIDEMIKKKELYFVHTEDGSDVQRNRKNISNETTVKKMSITKKE